MFDPKRYPKNWLSEIRPRILEREGHCCKFCGLADRVRGWWVPSGKFYTPEQFAENYIDPADEEALVKKMAKKPEPTLVILTVAHLDHGLSNHDDSNLAALCQRCHLNHDREATSAKRQQGKRYGKRRKQLTLGF